MKKNIFIVILGVSIICLLGLYNDMKYQRDVALTSVDWCVNSPETQRCKTSFDWQEDLTSWYTYPF